MPSAKSPSGSNNGPEVFSTVLRQAALHRETAQQATANIPSVVPSEHDLDAMALSAQTETPPAKTALKLPQLRADERVDATAPANENNTLLLMQSWQRGTRALADTSKAHLPQIIMFCGATISAMWLAAAVAYIHNIVGWHNMTHLLPHEIGGFLAGLLAPVALFWMILTFWLRSVDVKLYAAALRAEIQTLIFPSDEAERRVNNDIERLVRQTAEMSRATRLALGTLHQARKAVQGETQALQQGATDTAERLEALEQRLGERHRNLAELQNSFELKGQALQEIAARLLTDAASFDHLVGQTANKTAQIGQTLQAPLTQLQNWQDGIVDALNASLTKISDKQHLLRVDVADIEDKATHLADTLQGATAKLYDFTDDALDKAKLIETRLQGQGVSLQETLHHITTQTASLTAQRDQLLEILSQSGEQGRAELTAHVALLNETTQQLQMTQQTIAAQMQDVLQQAAGEWSAQGEQFNTQIQTGTIQAVGHINAAQGMLQQNYTDMQQHIAALTGDVQKLFRNAGEQWGAEAAQFNSLVEKQTAQNVTIVKQAQSGLHETYTALQTDLTQIGDRLNHLLTQTQTDLHAVTANVTDDLTQHQQHTAQFMTGLTDTHRVAWEQQALDLLSLQSALNALAVQLMERGNEVERSGQNTVQQLHTAHRDLQAGLDRLTTTTTGLQTGLAQAVSTIEEPLVKLDQAAQTAQDKAQLIGNMLDQRVNNLYELGSALTHQAGLLGTDLATKSQFLENVLVRLHGNIQTINTDMTAQTDLLDGRVQVTVEQVSRLLPDIRDLQQNFVAANSQLETAQHNILRLSDAAQQESQKLITLADSAVVQITGSLQAYKDLHDTQQTLHTQTLSQHQQLRAAYEQDTHLLSASQSALEDHATRTQHHYQQLHDVLNNLQMQAQQSEGAAGQARDTLQQTHMQLAQTGEALQRQTDQAAQNIRVVQHILDGSVQSAISHVANITGSLQQADKQALALQERAEKLHDLTLHHQSAAAQAAVQLAQTTTAATEAADQSQTRLTDLQAMLEQVQGLIATQNEALDDQRTTIEQNVTTALAQLQQQTDKLAQMTAQAGQQAGSIREQDQTLQRNYFFNATKFIVESLHSLSLDFTRMLDGELPEKTWKAYQKGDTSVFTKRLVGLRDSLSHDKLRQKFADDVEFRTYVQRYLRQFEEIHTHAKQQDYGDLLSGVFTSSDIGRLYQMLKTIVD